MQNKEALLLSLESRASCIMLLQNGYCQIRRVVAKPFSLEMITA